MHFPPIEIPKISLYHIFFYNFAKNLQIVQPELIRIQQLCFSFYFIDMLSVAKITSLHSNKQTIQKTELISLIENGWCPRIFTLECSRILILKSTWETSSSFHHSIKIGLRWTSKHVGVRLQNNQRTRNYYLEEWYRDAVNYICSYFVFCWSAFFGTVMIKKIIALSLPPPSIWPDV